MSFTETLTLLACQINIPPMTTAAERDAHLVNSVEKVLTQLDASDEVVDLVVLPELSSIEYARETFACLSDIAEPLDGASFQAWRKVATARNVHVCYSFARANEDEFCICSAVVGPDGALVGYYDKLHLAQYGASMEKDYFSRGDHLFIFEIKGFRCAPIICYDIRIPELTRLLVLEHDVDVILHCGAYYRDESFHTWHPFVVARALENQVFFLSLNRAGDHYGKSVFCPPWHDENIDLVHFFETQEDFRMLKLEHETLEQVRTEYSFLKDRLKDYRIPALTARR